MVYHTPIVKYCDIFSPQLYSYLKRDHDEGTCIIQEAVVWFNPTAEVMQHENSASLGSHGFSVDKVLKRSVRNCGAAVRPASAENTTMNTVLVRGQSSQTRGFKPGADPDRGPASPGRD